MAVRESGSPHQRARIELEKEDTEVQVGPYRADIVARAPIDDSRVVIENQLEEANFAASRPSTGVSGRTRGKDRGLDRP